jgi:hypothetical protein
VSLPQVIPPGLRSYTRHPWTVANDKLRAEGWRPTVSNEQAYVEGTEGKWYSMVTPKRRQEIALGAMIGGIAVGVVVAALTGRWWRRRAARRTSILCDVPVTSISVIGWSSPRRDVASTNRSGRRRCREPASLFGVERRERREPMVTGGSARTVTMRRSGCVRRSRDHSHRAIDTTTTPAEVASTTAVTTVRRQLHVELTRAGSPTSVPSSTPDGHRRSVPPAPARRSHGDGRDRFAGAASTDGPIDGLWRSSLTRRANPKWWRHHDHQRSDRDQPD